MEINLVFPWPAPELNPNSRACWQAKARAARTIRGYAGVVVLTCTTKTQREAFLAALGDGRVSIHYTITPPDKRRRDDDNIVAALKPLRDGIAAGLKVDDSRFDSSHRVMHDTVAPSGEIAVKLKVQNYD